MAQSNHSVEIEVTAQTAQAKKDLQEIEKMLNRLSQGAKVGLGAGGGGSGGGRGSAPAAMSKQAFTQQVALQAAKTGDKRLLEREKRVTKQVEEEEKRRTASHKETIDQNKQQNSLYAKQQESFLKRDTKAHEEEQKRITATHKQELQSRLEAQKQYYKEQNRAAKDAAAEAKKAVKDEEDRQKKLRRSKAREFKRAFEEEQRAATRRKALLAGGAYLGYRGVRRAGETAVGIGGAGSIEGAFSSLLQGVSALPVVGGLLAGAGQATLAGVNARTALQQNAAQFQPRLAQVTALTGATRQQQLDYMGTVASNLGIGPQRSMQQLAAVSAGSGRSLGATDLSRLSNLGLMEELVGGDAQSALSFIRSATLGRRRGDAGGAFGELGRIETFRRAQGLLPAESSMLRQAGAAFRQQGLAQGFAIDESSLFGLTQGIMRGQSPAAQSLTGAMGLAQRERQLGFGAFQDFAGQFADLPNTLLLAQAAQKGGGIGGIFKELSRLGGTPGASAQALSGAVSQFNIPRELIQAGVASRLGVGFGAAGDVLGASARKLTAADLSKGSMPPEMARFLGEDIELTRAFAGGEMGKLLSGFEFAGEGSVATLNQLLQANIRSEERLAKLSEDHLPALIKNMEHLNTKFAEGVNKISDGIFKGAEKLQTTYQEIEQKLNDLASLFGG